MFIQVITGTVADPEGLERQMERWQQELRPGAIGYLGTTAGVTDDGRVVVLARFESEDAARRNSERPEQGQWWAETAKLFDGEVTFRDCVQVHLLGPGGSDEAGFVQVMQGRYTDQDKAVDLLERSAEPLRALRPDVIGGELCLHADGGFTQAGYFTSEAEARAGEQKEPPAEVRALLDEEAAITADRVFYDLTDPWLHSPE